MKKKYDFVVSIGEACVCSESLRKSLLQIKSYPFDWLASNDILTNLDIVINDFKDFLNKDLLEQKNTNKTLDANQRNWRDTYRNTKYNFVFVHDFDYNVSFEESYPNVLKKYQRRIDRFYKSIEEANSVLFVYIERPKTNEEQISDLDLLVEYQKKLEEKFPNKNIDILYFRMDWERKYKDRIEKQLSEHVTFCQFYYSKYPYEVPKIVGNYFVLVRALKAKASLNIPLWRKVINPLIVLNLTIKKYLKIK